MSTPDHPAAEASVALVCPHCGAALHINTEWEGQPYLQVQVPEAIECYATDCGAVWEPNGTPRTAPRWEAYPDLYDAPARAIERAARLAAQPPATDRDALELRLLHTLRYVAELLAGDRPYDTRVEKAREVIFEDFPDLFLAARPAPAEEVDPRDPLGIVTPSPKPTCPVPGFGRDHLWTTGAFYVGSRLIQSDDYMMCGSCGQIEYDVPEEPTRPAPDTLADRVQALDDPAARHYAAFVGAEAERVRLAHAIEALADEWDDYEWTAPCATEREKGEAAGREKATWARADDLRALLAGRPDASPEGGEQRG